MWRESEGTPTLAPVLILFVIAGPARCVSVMNLQPDIGRPKTDRSRKTGREKSSN